MSGGVRGRKFLNQRNFLLLDCPPEVGQASAGADGENDLKKIRHQKRPYAKREHLWEGNPGTALQIQQPKPQGTAEITQKQSAQTGAETADGTILPPALCQPEKQCAEQKAEDVAAGR